MKKSGFSLIELLIVIAIMMLLLALLFPIVLRLKDKANVIKCVNNLKSIGIVNQAYAADNRGHIPHYQAHDCANGTETYVGWQNTVPWPLIQAQFNYMIGKFYPDYNALNSLHRDQMFQEMSPFYCPSPKGGKSRIKNNIMTGNMTYMTNYQFRTVHHSGNDGWQAPSGGWVLGTHQPDTWIAQAMIWWCQGWGDIIKIEGTDIKPGPYDIIYNNGTWICNGRHTGNLYPVLRLSGSAEAYPYPKDGGTPGAWNAGACPTSH